MARLSSALLIDPEKKGLATLTLGFVREGCRVMGASGYGEGVERAQTEAHDVVVVALRDGPAECRELLENLAERKGAPVPLIGLGHEDHRTIVEAMPSSDFLPMPALIRDIITASKLRAAFDPEKKEPVVSTPLSEFGVFALIRSLQATQRSAIIQLERGNHRGELRFSKGELNWAQVGSQQGVPALNQLLLWEEAAMEASFRAVVVKRSQFSVKGADLVEEAERFLRDFVASAKQIGNAQSVYEIVADKAEAGKSDFPPEVAPVLRLFDGKRSLADILDESPFRVFDTLKVMTGFIDAGVLRGVDPAGKASSPRGARSPLLEDWLKAPSEDEFVHSTATSAAHEGPKVQKKRAKTSTAPMTTLRSNAEAARDRKPSQPPATSPADTATTTATPAPAAMPAPTPAATVSPPMIAAPAAAAPAIAAPAPTAAVPPPADGGRLTGTSLPVARGELKTARREEKKLAPRPSMVIDIPTEDSPAQPPRPSATSTSTPAAAAPAPAAAATAPAPAAAATARPSGSIEVQPRKASDRTADRQVRPAGSIEISPDLLADMNALETSPPTPPAPAAPRGRTPPPARAPTPIPIRLPTGGRTRGLTPAPVRARRPSGEFNPIEKDFFAREADLYKKDAVEDFSDLDEPKRRGK